jgi:K(+)-stimulated pyrophosphate-energized sodium pump
MDLTYLALIGAVIGLLFALFQSRLIMKKSEGSDKVKKIAGLIRRGANAYLKRQYRGVILFFIVVTVVLVILAITGFVTFLMPVAFVTGGFFSGLAGFVGMKIATYSNSRTVTAAKSSLNQGLRVAFSSGTVMGMTVVGLGLLLLTVWYFILKAVFTGPDALQQITTTLLTCGMGASSMALFARVGGGIFTKAADVGADLVGKVEAGIPEDDPRNPAVIADNVGDNVGDVAGMGADLYESYIGSIISSAALAVAAGLGTAGVLLPLILAALGIVASVIGTFFVHTKENASQKALLSALRKGVYISSVIIAVVSFFVVQNVLGEGHMGIFFAILSGLVAGILIGFYTEYTTSDTYKPTQDLSASTSGGPATVIISGLALGMRSTFFPIVIVAVSVIISFFASGGGESFNTGLFAVGISAVGMLSTLGITLATDAYGPVADNAGGIAEMSGEPHEVRERTDALDSLGNTTAASGKGFAIGSAALTALALIATFVTQAQSLGADFDLSLLNPALLMGLFIGVMLPFLFSSMTMSAVGSAAQMIVTEVRRQFKEIKGLMEGKAEPDYETCVDICTRSAQKKMIPPAIVTIIAPILIGILLGVSGVVGMLAGATASGFVLAIMMANSGGAWDNAKKYIEGGAHGGKGSDAHKAAVVGDTVGDPFKDTSGPSLNILIKLLSIIAVVFCSFIISSSIM